MLTKYFCIFDYYDYNKKNEGDISPIHCLMTTRYCSIEDTNNGEIIVTRLSKVISDSLGDNCELHGLVNGRRKDYESTAGYTFKYNTRSENDQRLRMFAIKDGNTELCMDRPALSQTHWDEIRNTMCYSRS